MEFRLPELGEGVHEGELVKWIVKAGDSVKFDQPLCEVMTDKATIEIPSPFEGKIVSLSADEGKAVKVGEVLLSYEGAAPAKTAVAAPAASVSAAPITRKYAQEMGVKLSQIQGSGPGGRILMKDVEQAAVPARQEERVPFVGLRKRIAEKMRLSKDKAAHYTYVEEADATELVRLRNQAREMGEKNGIKVTYLPFVMKAMVAALKQFPVVNSTLDESTGQLVYKHYYNIGLSIQTDDGLTAPVIKDVEHKPVLQLAQEIQSLVERARKKQLTVEDFHGGTITLTNAGSIGGLFATPVINYPEVAILGFNKISRKPVVKMENGREAVVIRDWTYFSISCDHRVVDGAVAAGFMKCFIRYIEAPDLLVLEL